MMSVRNLVSFILLWMGCPFTKATNRPIIGIVMQELLYHQDSYPFYDDYIAASYVKAAEGAGAQVVAVPTGQSRDYYKDLINSINGLLIPGGAAPFNGTDGYYATSKILYELAIEMNQRIRFPVYGVCMGFHFLVHVTNKEVDVRKKCYMLNKFLPIQFAPKFKRSSLFKKAPASILRTLRTTNTTVHFHQWCHYPADVEKTKLLDEWKVLAKAKDDNGTSFLAIIEHKKYPFLATIFHPEKNIYEWKIDYPNSHQAVETSRYFYDWLVNQARLNDNRFSSPVKERRALIHNHTPVLSSQNTGFSEIYLFKTRWGSRHGEPNRKMSLEQ